MHRIVATQAFKVMPDGVIFKVIGRGWVDLIDRQGKGLCARGGL
jgi:hypothetical protein